MNITQNYTLTDNTKHAKKAGSIEPQRVNLVVGNHCN